MRTIDMVLQGIQKAGWLAQIGDPELVGASEVSDASETGRIAIIIGDHDRRV